MIHENKGVLDKMGVIGYIFQIINVPEGDDIGCQEHVSPVGCNIPCNFFSCWKDKW